MGNGDKVIMYDAPDTAVFKTNISGWVGADGRFWGKDEHMARWCACTHMKCECGNIREKHWLLCKGCMYKKNREKYNALPFKEWDGKEPVVTRDGDKYFFSEEELIEWIYDYNEDNEDEPMVEVELLFCEPIYYSQINYDSVGADEAHEDWEPEEELIQAINTFNETIKKFPAHSYTTGKVRTSYKYTPQ